MPSDLPKVTAYVSADTRDRLDRASRALGQSRSALVGELLEAAMPMLDVLADAAITVRLRGEVQREAFAKAADEMRPLTHQGQDLMQQMIELVTAASGEGPPPSNTGVRIQ
jgi:predicted DNA-binding protein